MREIGLTLKGRTCASARPALTAYWWNGSVAASPAPPAAAEACPFAMLSARNGYSRLMCGGQRTYDLSYRVRIACVVRKGLAVGGRLRSVWVSALGVYVNGRVSNRSRLRG